MTIEYEYLDKTVFIIKLIMSKQTNLNNIFKRKQITELCFKKEVRDKKKSASYVLCSALLVEVLVFWGICAYTVQAVFSRKTASVNQASDTHSRYADWFLLMTFEMFQHWLFYFIKKPIKNSPRFANLKQFNFAPVEVKISNVCKLVFCSFTGNFRSLWEFNMVVSLKNA